MTEATAGREPIQIVEIQQPLCQHDFGVAPCQAVGAADSHCYNTRSTCRDPDNFSLGTPLSLFFSRGFAADRGVVPLAIPSLRSVSTSPTKINLAASNPDAQGLGNRALCKLTFTDHQHTDNIVDPYVSGRSWNPLDASRGSFWSRWIARNRYRQNVTIKVYEGYAGQLLSEMKCRTYFMQSIKGPDSSGTVTIEGKDILARIEERKAQAPVASPGVLYTDIDASQTTFEVAGALLSEYDASGTLRVGDEVMTYTAVATSTNGIEFTGITRATDGTTADSHSLDDSVQQCLRYENLRPNEVLVDLLTTFGGIDPAYLDSVNWATEVTSNLSLYRLTSLITTPESVAKLVNEIQQQSLLYLFWDERDALVKLRAVRANSALPPLITDAANIIAGSWSTQEKPRERASQVWVYFNQTDYARSATDANAYASQVVLADLASEADELYGEASVRKIFARWLPTSALATNTATTIILRYVDTPTELKIRVDAKDRSYWVGDTFRARHYLDVDEFGAARERFWTILSAEEVVAGEVIEYVCEDTTVAGIASYIMATGSAAYSGYENAPDLSCYIGDAAGLLADGENSGRIT